MNFIKKPNYHYKNLAIFLLSLTFLVTSKTGYSAIIDELIVNVYTLTGELATIYNPATGQNEPDPTNPWIKEETGKLFLKNGFISSGNRIVNAKSLGISVSTANAIKGKYMIGLATWVGLNNITPLTDFPRSSTTYDFNGVPYVTVTTKGSSGDNTGNTPGNVCTSTSTTITAGNPTVSISALQPNAAEAGPINGRFQIDLDAPRAKKIVVAYTISGSASNGKDYAKIKNSVVIPAGTTSAYVDITPINDKKKEVTETVTLNIKASGAYTLSSSTSADVNIADND